MTDARWNDPDGGRHDGCVDVRPIDGPVPAFLLHMIVLR